MPSDTIILAPAVRDSNSLRSNADWMTLQELLRLGCCGILPRALEGGRALVCVVGRRQSGGTGDLDCDCSGRVGAPAPPGSPPDDSLPESSPSLLRVAKRIWILLARVRMEIKMQPPVLPATPHILPLGSKCTAVCPARACTSAANAKQSPLSRLGERTAAPTSTVNHCVLSPSGNARKVNEKCMRRCANAQSIARTMRPRARAPCRQAPGPGLCTCGRPGSTKKGRPPPGGKDHGRRPSFASSGARPNHAGARPRNEKAAAVAHSARIVRHSDEHHTANIRNF